MGEHEEKNDGYDPMAMVDMALAFSAPVISVRNSFLEAGMGTELTDHIVMDFAHYLLTTMTAQHLASLNSGDPEPTY